MILKPVYPVYNELVPFSYFKYSHRTLKDFTTQEQIIDLSYNGSIWQKNEALTYNSRGLTNQLLQKKGIEVDLFV